MTFIRPTLSELIARGRADQDARLPGADSRLPASVLDVLARSHAAAANGLYGYIDWLARQILPDSADGEFLARHASLWLEQARKGAIGAVGTVNLTGTAGIVVPAGTALVRADGREYRTSADVTLGAGATAAGVEDVLGGPDGNSAAGSELLFVQPLAGVNAAAPVTAAGLAGGVAEEDDAALRARVLSRIRKPPHGGNKDDYVTWALEVPEVTRAYCFPGWMGPGSVGVTFVLDQRASILPTEGDIAAVTAHIDARRPVTAALVVFAPIPFPIDLFIRSAPTTAEVRAAILAEIDDFFARDAQPGGTIYLSRLREAISIAAGEIWHDLELPSANITVGAGALPVLGTVTWL